MCGNTRCGITTDAGLLLMRHYWTTQPQLADGSSKIIVMEVVVVR